MKNKFSFFIIVNILFCILISRDIETMLQELKIENALQEKLSTMIENKLLNESEYVLIVNATMRKKPLSTPSSSDNSSNTEATFTLPGFPLKNLQESRPDNTIVSSDSDYLLYFLEIVVYVEGDKISGKLKTDLRQLIVEGVPDIRDCEDCIRIEQDYDATQKQIINWQFDRLEEQLAITQDALAEKESREEERIDEAKILLNTKLAELEEIKIQFDALIQAQKTKIDHLDQKNEERLDYFIKGTTTNSEADKETPPISTEPWYKFKMNTNKKNFNDGKYKISNKNSEVEWIGKKLYSQNSGIINLKKGYVIINNNILERGEIIIDMQSIVVTDIEPDKGGLSLASHLKDPDFFNVDLYPNAHFKIAEFQDLKKVNNQGICYIKGNLTILNITKPYTIKLKLFPKEDTIRVLGNIEVDRTDFNITYGSNSYFDIAADMAIDNIFDLNFKLIATKY